MKKYKKNVNISVVDWNFEMNTETSGSWSKLALCIRRVMSDLLGWRSP